jgi:hypothetical protein
VRSRIHDRRCPSRSGWGEALGARKRGERCWSSEAKSRGTSQPLTRDYSASSLRKEREPTSASARRAKVRGARSGSGFHRSAVVLVDRFDCRSRRAARGVVRSRAKSSRRRRGLVSPHRSEGRKSVGSRPAGGKTRGPVAGQLSRAGNSSIEGASGRGSRSFLTKGRWKWSWWRREASAPRRCDRERQRLVHPPRAAAEKAAAKGRRLRATSIWRPTRSSRRSHPRQKTGGVWMDSPKLAALRQSAQPLEPSGGALAPVDVA